MMAWDYALAWLIYLSFGVLFGWQVRRFIRQWGNLARWLCLGSFWVLAFTPWELAEYPGYFAPALVTLMMDLLLKGSANTLEGGLVLLIAYVSMVVGVVVFALVKRSKAVPQAASDSGSETRLNQAPKV